MKRISTILILSVLSFGAWAQNSPLTSYGFRLGLTATPTFGWIKPEQGKTNGIGLGFSYGLIGDFNFAPNYSFSTALTITSINGKSTEANVLPYYAPGSAPKAYDLKYKLQYIDLPLTIKLKTVKTDGKRWYGQFGLSNSINISAKQDAVTGGTVVGDNLNVSDHIKLYRAGLIIGGGGEFDISGNTSIVAGLTFNNGFTNIVTDKARDVRSHYLALNFGVFF
ncbi:Outer membrane protein beta-barrel domain-containing protein [Pedobacter terrae]|uniref:Outer membrane protein beta-barrel domain-containing protein n=1 Tax=Pedobacter terrae TaxID=405671 RepID=A0A1G7ZWJ4_9SPHI|nr:porin family protein [Pedobacter terrae]SDH13055.1 Outer membrane protein beta-barrel domain-containing protein [Pedobacter terrae]SDH43456.1 Outer membrane protein beta-barrel domain-containing protein [Pedobacter terrae]